ncbi:hypothetical protein A0U93_11990 [Neoasaia chiangmaiensis]|uniref:Glycosyltransferase 2-like domain-containing protein n=1 Tax=Neoasaia chiangmaiensis TaxID=320497 RepID=A0A1U9KS48_9PROT|nr:hypothetical protein A0U93_11990 [Neoasaia chiangmaiensis]
MSKEHTILSCVTVNRLSIFDEPVPADALQHEFARYLPFLLWVFDQLSDSNPCTITFTSSCGWMIRPLREMLGNQIFERRIALLPHESQISSIVVTSDTDPRHEFTSSATVIRFSEQHAHDDDFHLDSHVLIRMPTPSGTDRAALAWLADPAYAAERRILRRRAATTAALWQSQQAQARLLQQRQDDARRIRTLVTLQRDMAYQRDAALAQYDRTQAAYEAAVAERDAALSERHAQSATVPPRRALPLRAVRYLGRRLRPRHPPVVAAPVTAQLPSSERHILFIAGEPDTPGVAYRCDRLAEAARAAGYATRVMPCATIGGDDVAWADIMVLWRVEFSGHVDILLRLGREKGATLVFDADDIVFIPHLARIDVIDGIRSIGATEERIERCFADMRRTMLRCDLGFATTRELGDAMRVNLPLTHEVPNIFNDAAHAKSRLAHRRRIDDGLVRIGYATGSRTHQRDFAAVAPVLADLLRTYPHVRLVLFREAGNRRPVLLMEEFPALETIADRIEWRDMVALADLPDEFARFDISIAPLETGNVFCEAKSEIKFFEPALAGAACIASPTGPFRRVIRPGITGFLADTPEEWAAALRNLIENPGKRRRMAQDAYHDVLWHFGPQAQTQRLRTIFDGLGATDADAARSAETLLSRQAMPRAPLPVVPESDALFERDLLGGADVTVVVTSYNYSTYILDALDSVRAQTLSPLDLIVVDDGSTDDSVTLVEDWMTRHAERFNRLILRRTRQNAGLGGARNVGMAATETPFVMQLDADNRLLPDACARLRDAMADGQTAYAYPVLRAFNTEGIVMGKATPDDPDNATRPDLLGNLPFEPLALIGGNHVDAMAMVAKWAWAAVGGYYVARDAMGWEDYDLWCGLAERGLTGRHVPEVLAEYRHHDASMTNGITERAAHKARVVSLVTERHPWIRLVAAEARQRQ